MVFLFCFDIQNNFGAQHVLQMLRASEKDLPVPYDFTRYSTSIENQTKIYSDFACHIEIIMRIQIDSWSLDPL